MSFNQEKKSYCNLLPEHITFNVDYVKCVKSKYVKVNSFDTANKFNKCWRYFVLYFTSQLQTVLRKNHLLTKIVFDIKPLVLNEKMQDISNKNVHMKNVLAMTRRNVIDL